VEGASGVGQIDVGVKDRQIKESMIPRGYCGGTVEVAALRLLFVQKENLA
jgi:hypothetical protein